MKFAFVLAGLLATTSAFPAWGQATSATSGVAFTGAQLAARFGALPEIEHISLSPNGQKAAVISPVARGQVVLVVDLVKGGAPRPIVRETTPGEHLQSCDWATDERLVCNIAITAQTTDGLLNFSRLIAVNSDGSDSRKLTAEAGANAMGYLQKGGWLIDWHGSGGPGTVLMTRQYVPENSLNTRLNKEADGLGVESVDVETLVRKPVEPARRSAISYVSDGKGEVRLMALEPSTDEGFTNGRVDYFYRKAGSRSWDKLGQVTSTTSGQNTGFAPAAVDSDLNVAYGFASKNGFQALYRRKLDGSNADELVLGRGDVDVDRLLTIGRNARVVGASYATERRVNEFFDPQLKALGAGLKKALLDQPNVDFYDSSADESKLLLLASSDTQPGQFYLYDKDSHHLEALLQVRPQLNEIRMGAMQPMTFPAADGTRIPGYLTLPPGGTGKNLPAIVMPHGGPGSRDEWGFDWLVQFFAVRGYAVLQPNYRGSTGYGADWYKRNGFQSWRTAIGDVNDAGRWLQAQGIAAPGKLAIFGWSYGGYAALQSPMLDPNLFKAIVAVAPVTDLEMLRRESENFTSKLEVDAFIGHGSFVREGSPAQNAAVIKAPVLLFHGDRDTNVAIAESRVMADRLRSAGKQVQLVEFPGLAHSLVDAAARTRLLGESDTFLRKHLGLPAE